MDQEKLPMKIGTLLALLTLLLGFGLGAAFGLAEDSIKDSFFATAKETLASTADDPEQAAVLADGGYARLQISATQHPTNRA